MAKKIAKGMPEPTKSPKVISNRKARFDYELLQFFEAGIALAGSEVKSIFNGRANMVDAYCQIKGDELWILNLDIEPYENAKHFQPDRMRDRKLLLHRAEIHLIERRSMEKGLTIVPTKIYFNHGKVKLEIALARGKRSYDKRDQIAKDDTRRDIERMKRRDLM
ncbi:MAG TPA: SsrA-binding protein SmpB [Fimbriimonadaceae bacterium]|jgi:SsrA-binding protein